MRTPLVLNTLMVCYFIWYQTSKKIHLIMFWSANTHISSLIKGCKVNGWYSKFSIESLTLSCDWFGTFCTFGTGSASADIPICHFRDASALFYYAVQWGKIQCGVYHKPKIILTYVSASEAHSLDHNLAHEYSPMECLAKSTLDICY